MAKNRLYSPEFLKELVADPGSSVELKKSVKEILLQPFHLRDIAGAVAEILDSSLLRLDPSLDGLLLGYQNAKLLGDKAPCHLESSQVSVKIQADFYIFRPRVGNTYKAVVVKLGVAHVCGLLYSHFNVSLPISPEKLGLLETLTLQTEVTFILEEFDLTNELPFFKGQLATISSRPAEQPTESKKSKKLKDPPKILDLDSSQLKEDAAMTEKKKQKLPKLALNEGKVFTIAPPESKVESGPETKKKRSLSLKQIKITKEKAEKTESEDEDPGRLITPYQRPKENSRPSLPNLGSDRDGSRLSKRFIKSLRESPLKGLVLSRSSDSDSDLDLPSLKGNPGEATTDKTHKSPKSVASPSQPKKATPVQSCDSQRRNSQSAAPLFSFLSSKNSPAKSPDKGSPVRSLLAEVFANTSPIKGFSSQESVSMITSTQKSPARLKSPPFRSRDGDSSSDDEVEKAARSIIDKSTKDQLDAASSSEDEGPQGQALVEEGAESSDSDGKPTLTKPANQLNGSVGQGTTKGGEMSSSEDEEPPGKKDGKDSDSEEEPTSTNQLSNGSKERPKPGDSDDRDTREKQTPSRTNASSGSKWNVDAATPARPLFAVDKAKTDSTQRKSLSLISFGGQQTKESSSDSSSDDEEPAQRLFPSKQDLNKSGMKSTLGQLDPKKSLNQSSLGGEQTKESLDSSSDDEEPAQRLFSPKPTLNKSGIKSTVTPLSLKQSPVNRQLHQTSFGGQQTKESSSDSSSDDEEPAQRLFPSKQDLNKSGMKSTSGQLDPKNSLNQSSLGGEQTKESSSDSSSDDEEPAQRLFPSKQDFNKSEMKSTLGQLDPKKSLNQSSLGGEQTKESSSDSSSEDEEPAERLFPPKRGPAKSSIKSSLAPLSLKKPLMNQTLLDASVQARSPLACSTPTNEDPKLAQKNSLIRSVLKPLSGGTGEQTPKPDKKKSKSKQPDFESPQVKSSEKKNKSDSGVDVRRSGESDSDDLDDSLRLLAQRVYSGSISPKIVANEKTKKEDLKKKSKLAIPQTKSSDVAVVQPSTRIEDATAEEMRRKNLQEKTAVESAEKNSKKRKLQESGQEKLVEEGGKKEKDSKKRKLFSSKTEDSFIGVNRSLGLGKISETILVSGCKQTDALAKLDSKGSSPSREVGAKKEKKSILFGGAHPADTQADSKKEVSTKKKRSKKPVELDDSIDEILSLVGKDMGIDKPKKKKKKEKDVDAVRMPPPDATSTVPKKAKSSTGMPTEAKEGLAVPGPTQTSKPQTEGDTTSKKKSKKKKEAIGFVNGQTSDLPMPSVITQVKQEPSKSQDGEESSSKKKSKKKKKQEDAISLGSGKTADNHLQLPSANIPDARVNPEPPKAEGLGESSSKMKSKKKKDTISVGSEHSSDLPAPTAVIQDSRVNQEPPKSEEVGESSSKKTSKKKKKRDAVSVDSRQTPDLPAPTAVIQETRVNQEPPKSENAGESSSKKKSKKKKKRDAVSVDSRQTPDLPAPTAVVQETRVNQEPPKSENVGESSSKKKKSKKKEKALGLISGQTSDVHLQPTAGTQDSRLNQEPSKSQDMGGSSSKKKSKRKLEEAVSIGSGQSADVRPSLPVDSEIPAKKKKVTKMEKTEKTKPKSSGSKSAQDSDDSDDDAAFAGILQNLLKNAKQFVNNEVAESGEKKKKGKTLIKKSKIVYSS